MSTSDSQDTSSNHRPAYRNIFATIIAQLRLSVATFTFVFWLTFPILLGLRIIEMFIPLLVTLGNLLVPIMQLVGLPGQAGVGWAAAILIQPLAGFALLAENWHELQLSTAQATIFALLLLEAHAIVVEVRLAQYLGVRAWVTVLLRFGTAFALGFLLNHFFLALNWLQEPATLFVVGTAGDTATWVQWLFGQLRIWVVFFTVIFMLNLLMYYLRIWNIERIFIFLLKPLMRILGIHHSAAVVAIIGLVLGITYGAALLLNEMRSGKIDRRDMFLTVATLSICHSLLEDSLISLLFGAHLFGVLFARIVFTILIIASLSRLMRLLPDNFCEHWLMTPPLVRGKLAKVDNFVK